MVGISAKASACFKSGLHIALETQPVTAHPGFPKESLRRRGLLTTFSSRKLCFKKGEGAGGGGKEAWLEELQGVPADSLSLSSLDPSE